MSKRWVNKHHVIRFTRLSQKGECIRVNKLNIFCFQALYISFELLKGERVQLKHGYLVGLA
ncbi:Uncharacterised protein [Vibrio cholerae]|nr:Uncharacterised protein [Vibrio cholerae]CSC77128.1 Uncharacterised protein [Vibrio cholerae]CSI94069.1 Uncharacterised protein [Vibrio cholerae]